MKYTATVSTISAYDSEVIMSSTGTLEELAQWGYLGDPANPALDPHFNPFNDDLYMIEDAVNPVTGEIVRGYRCQEAPALGGGLLASAYS